LAVYPDTVLALRGRVAWAHDWVSDPTLMAVFQSIRGRASSSMAQLRHATPR
jgi:hypothetical protein